MKKKKRLLVLLLLTVVVVCIAFLVIRIKQNKRIPYIAFMHNADRAHCLYICSDGKIYASTSEESFVMDNADVIEKIRQNDYADILEYVGSTKAGKVRRMHRLFMRVVIDKEYYFKRPMIQLFEESKGRKQYWSGMYYSEEGKPVTRSFYISNVTGKCTDERAYKIVDWMYGTLKDYMKPDEWTE